VKHVKILFLVIFFFLSLNLVSCVPGGVEPAQGWSGVACYDGMLYVGSMDSKIVKVDPTTPSIEWSYTIASAPSQGMLSCGRTSALAAIYGTPVPTEDLVYVGAYNGKVYALNRDTGYERWIYPKEGYIGPIVANTVVDGDNAIYVSSSDGRVYALNTSYGEFRWSSEPLSEKLWTTLTIKDDIIYLSTYENNIYTLSTKNGNLLPRTFKADAGFSSSPIIYQDTLFVGSFDNNLYAIKVGSDGLLWKFPGGRWFWSTPVSKDNIVYAGCLDGKVYAINAETGDLEWEFDTGSPIVSSPVLDADLLIVASESGDVYVFDTNIESNDEVMVPVRTMSINAVIKGSLCVQEGIIYVRAQDNYLYALDIEKGLVTWSIPVSGKKES